MWVTGNESDEFLFATGVFFNENSVQSDRFAIHWTLFKTVKITVYFKYIFKT